MNTNIGYQLIWSTLLAFFLMACGGEDQADAPNAQSVRDSDSGYSLDIALYDSVTGEANTSISSSAPGEIRVTLMQYGRPSVSEIVSLSSTLGTIGVSTGALLTDSNGEARARLISDGLDGAGTVTASVSLGGKNLSVDLNFSSVGGEVSDPETLSIRLALLSESGVSNTIRGDDPGILTATVTSQNGVPIVNQLMTFSGESVNFNPATGTSLTDGNGQASIQVLAGDSIGIATLSAAMRQGDTDGSVSQTLNITIAQPAIKLGSGLGDNFVEGRLQTGLDTVSAGATVSVSASVVDGSNNAFTDPVNVGFTSPCVALEQATIDASVTAVNGLANATYRATGCVGRDTITANIDFGGAQFTASAELEIANDDVGSIVFTRAEPTTIVLKGSGGQGLAETSMVTFQVFGAQGLPLANQRVDFSLTSNVGGIELSPAFAVSDAEGFVSTSVQSGNISTSVVVIATLEEVGIATQSASLVVSTGVPDQDSLSISLSQLNPEAWSVNGTEVSVTAYAADVFNNAVPDGITFSFFVEGGRIEPSCTSLNGSCTVTWTSQNPKPVDGQVSILVTAIGGESFQDENGNGVFDDGDTFDDLSEAFRDDDRNGTREAGEPFIDFNGSGIYDLEDGLFGGPSCQDTARCSPLAGVTVRDSSEFVMSGSNATISFSPPSGSAYTSRSAINLTIQDTNGNSMPGDSIITIVSELGELLSASTYTVPMFSKNPHQSAIVVDLTDVDPPSGSGFITVLVTTPRGTESAANYVFTY